MTKPENTPLEDLGAGVLPPGADAEMFIGWGRAPRADRRFLLGALPLALAGVGGLAAALARGLEDPGAGAWLTGATHEIAGRLVMRPYPMIEIADASAPYGLRTALLVAVGKCTSGLKLADHDGAIVRAAGVLIERRGRQMLEVPLTLGDWLSIPAPGEAPAPPPAQTASLGPARLKGAIMDSKCFFGVMRPGRGKTHKACASLCIRGGIPPSFWVRMSDGREGVLLMTDAAGGPLGEDILPFVADPVEAEGEIVRVGDLLQFRADAGAYRRLA